MPLRTRRKRARTIGNPNRRKTDAKVNRILSDEYRMKKNGQIVQAALVKWWWNRFQSEMPPENLYFVYA